MKVGVIFGSLVAGGAERVCLKIVEALKEANHEVTLITLTKTNWQLMQKMFGHVSKPDREMVLFKRGFSAFGAYKPLLAAVAMQRLRRRFDLVINAQGDVMPIRADITYVHYPTFAEYENVSVNLKYSQSMFWRLYFAPYKLVHGLFKNYLKHGILITNSTFSKKAVEKHAGRRAIVVTPSVNIKQFTTTAKHSKRENLVVACGRYSPEKNYEYVLEAAKHLKQTKFAIIGSTSGEKSAKYYEKLTILKAKNNIANAELLKDLPLEDLLNLYSKAKVFMHAMENEHFGIAIVEAMAAGLVPVVYRAGGPWEDILKAKQGHHGFSYKTPKEAATIIEKIMINEPLRNEIVQRNLDYANEFSEKHFKEKITTLVRNIA